MNKYVNVDELKENICKRINFAVTERGKRKNEMPNL